jgi:hypothetical protein
MKLYHYATWQGSKVAESKVILPSVQYGFGRRTVLNDWPGLVFLTKNPEWERSIQALSLEEFHEKCGSCPETYSQLSIPCWKFEVEVHPQEVQGVLILRLANNRQWQEMIEDAVSLGSNVKDWLTSDEPQLVTNAWQWKDGGWR